MTTRDKLLTVPVTTEERTKASQTAQAMGYDSVAAYIRFLLLGAEVSIRLEIQGHNPVTLNSLEA